MRIEPKAAFYNEETGAVQPWKDIEVTDSVGNALVSEGLAIAIAEGGGGGGSSDFSTAEVTVTYIKNPGATLISEAGVVTLVGGEMEGADVKPLDSGTFTLVLYKGKFNGTVIDVAAVTESTGSIVLGEAEEREGNYETPVTITGDCAFTVTGVEL